MVKMLTERVEEGQTVFITVHVFVTALAEWVTVAVAWQVELEWVKLWVEL